MPYCSKCGVEVDDNVEKCPLCQTPIQKITGMQDIPPGKFPKDLAGIIPERRAILKHDIYLTWMIYSVLLFAPFFAILTIGIQYRVMFAWAGYSLLSISAAWVGITLILFFMKRPVILACGLVANLGALLFFLNLLGGRLTWFFPLGLPLLILSSLLTFAVIFLSARVNDKGLNIGAFILIASGIFCLCLDMLLNLYLTARIRAGWSIVACSSILPLALFLFLLHYIQKKRIKFKRYFHL